jgi:hypothetical protein
LSAAVVPQEFKMPSPTSAETELHRLFWARQNSLASWATSAAAAVLEQLPVHSERSGYRHDTSTDRAGIVTHELVELDSSLPVCLVFERVDGSQIAGFCQPWPAVLARFINAVIDGNLLIGTACGSSTPILVR